MAIRSVAFAAKPRDFTQKVNRKMYRSAMASILSELIRREQLVVVDSLKLNEPKHVVVADTSEINDGEAAPFTVLCPQSSVFLELGPLRAEFFEIV